MAELSLRLKTIASLVSKGARVCDVGTDHARLAIYLKQTEIADKVIATDLNQMPLKFARKNIEKSGIKNISLRHCDGLACVKKGEADTVIVAGIGGEVISGILSRCDWLKSGDITLILQPTTSPDILRRFLAGNGFDIKEEIPIFENGKIYSVIKAEYSEKENKYPEYFYYIGKVPKTESGIIYIKKQQKRIADYVNAYKNLPGKQEDYLIYSEVLTEIEKLLTEND